MRHPQHDEIVAVVRGWYRQSYPEMGYQGEQRRYGWYARNVIGAGMSRIELAEIDPGDIANFLTDARKYFDNAELTLHVDDRYLDAALRPALVTAGCVREQATVYLAHVGSLPDAPEVNFVICDESLLEEHAVAKLKGFRDSEDEPARTDVIAEVSLRQAELAGTGRFALARINGQAAGTIGWYTGDDAFIFDLSTRVPYRGRGIATALIWFVLESECRKGARSVVINADEGGQPAQLYKRLGFTDKVYWRQQYRLTAHA